MSAPGRGDARTGTLGQRTGPPWHLDADCPAGRHAGDTRPARHGESVPELASAWHEAGRVPCRHCTLGVVLAALEPAGTGYHAITCAGAHSTSYVDGSWLTLCPLCDWLCDWARRLGLPSAITTWHRVTILAAGSLAGDQQWLRRARLQVDSTHPGGAATTVDQPTWAVAATLDATLDEALAAAVGLHAAPSRSA